ncbi:MAG: D-alanyl-D-alanine carboxypeptidase [Solirubrobacteraceae bacterium]
MGLRNLTLAGLAGALVLGAPAAIANAGSGGVPTPGANTGVSASTGASGSTGAIAAAAVAKLDTTMTKAMRGLGNSSGAYVVDLDSGQVLFADDPTVPRYPASVEKLYTLTTALALFGLDGTLQTSVWGVGQVGAGGVWDGDLYLRGGGDPTFGDQTFIQNWYGGAGTTAGALASQLIAATHITRVDGSVIGDESYFDSLRGDPASGYGPDPNLVGELSALSFDRGAVGNQGSPPAHAAWEFAGTLRHAGISVSGRSQAGTTPPAAHLLASVESPPMSELAALTAGPSDDFFAEMILKAIGARFGAGGTTADGAAVVRSYLAKLGLTPQIVDGSGLSRGDLTSPLAVVTLLRDLSPGGDAILQAVGSTLRSALPIVGETGTLAARMVGTPAAGNCQAKTGTLSDASDLAGWCDGRFAFALLMNHVVVWKAQEAQDKMVEALAKLAAPQSSASRPASSSTRTPRRSAFSSFEPGDSPATR